KIHTYSGQLMKRASTVRYPTFEQVLKLATTFEIAQRTKGVIQELGVEGHTSHQESNVDRIARTRTGNRSPRVQNTNASCERCGSFTHMKPWECWARDVKCYGYNQKGHIRRCCRNRKRSLGKINGSMEDDITINNIEDMEGSIHAVAESISLEVNGRFVTMEYDTYAAISIISEKLWSQLGSPKLS
ncbi:hypothetical protein ACOME3_010362, partial [Neoechinorhynchus agilis]